MMHTSRKDASLGRPVRRSTSRVPILPVEALRTGSKRAAACPLMLGSCRMTGARLIVSATAAGTIMTTIPEGAANLEGASGGGGGGGGRLTAGHDKEIAPVEPMHGGGANLSHFESTGAFLAFCASFASSGFAVPHTLQTKRLVQLRLEHSTLEHIQSPPKQSISLVRAREPSCTGTHKGSG